RAACTASTSTSHGTAEHAPAAPPPVVQDIHGRIPESRVATQGCPAQPCSRARSGVLELGDHDLALTEEHLGDPRGALGVGHQLSEAARDDLPAEAEPVLEPAALRLLAAVGEERVPEVVDLLLVLAVDPEGDGLVEPEERPRVESLEPPAAEFEVGAEE